MLSSKQFSNLTLMLGDTQQAINTIYNLENDHHTIIIDGKLFENQFVNIDELIQIFSNFKKHHLTYVLVTHADNLINALDHPTQIFDVFRLLSPQINVVLSEEYEDYQKYLANNHILTGHMQVIDLP